jgi:alkaline phosphatase D
MMNPGRILGLLFLFLEASLSLSLAQAESPFRIAILGCHRQFEPAPALVRYVESQPDLCLWIGDNIYADTQTDLAHLQSCYDALAAKPAFQQLMKAAPYLATWDDHDFGDNNEWKDYPLKAESKQLFREFWKLESTIPAEQEGIYYAEIHTIQEKQVQIIMLDVRYHRDEPGLSADMLGEAQWEWLGQELQKEADLRLIVSGTQLLLTKESGSETWDEYPQARQRLFELIESAQAEQVLFITGDQHYGEVCRKAGALGYDAIELQFAGINQNEEPEFNPLRVAPAATALHSYALLDLQLQPTATEVPHVLFRIYDALSNELELIYRVNLSEISLQVDFDADTAFVREKRVQIHHPYPELELRYTTDGSIPGPQSPRFEQPFRIRRSTLVQARLFTQDGVARSKVFAQQYEQLKPQAAEQPNQLSPGLRYEYAEGNFQRLPDFSVITPQRRVARWRFRSQIGPQQITLPSDIKAISRYRKRECIIFR